MLLRSYQFVIEWLFQPDSALSTRASMGSRSTSQLSRFDFAKANKSELQLAGMSKATRRHRELLHLIELDFAHFDYFDMAPVRDYEFYIQNFGQSNRIQIQTQTGDDSEEVELQTDEVDIFNAWTQHPPTDAKGSGGIQILSSCWLVKNKTFKSSR